MTPLEHYRQDCQRPDFVADAAQQQAVEALDDLYHRLIKADDKPARGFWKRKQSTEPVTGLYMWGGVGRGKTYLMDVFYQALPLEQKARTHFHHFMREVHQELTKRQGEKNPLTGIAREYASNVKVLCLDEFFVTDITDAMLLGGLFTELFALGTTLVTTSNIEPDGLYWNGLQRQRFLPAIEQLKKFTQVMNVDGGTDFRMRHLTLTERWSCPLGEEADAFMEQWLVQLTEGNTAPTRNAPIDVEGRELVANALGDKVAWFDFMTLCDGPRSQNDYIALAEQFDTILLSNVERMGSENDDQARRFINLVDEFYDSGINLIISSEEPITELYTSGHLEFEFQRTESRLQEMQSEEYLQAN